MDTDKKEDQLPEFEYRGFIVRMNQDFDWEVRNGYNSISGEADLVLGSDLTERAVKRVLDGVARMISRSINIHVDRERKRCEAFAISHAKAISGRDEKLEGY